MKITDGILYYIPSSNFEAIQGWHYSKITEEKKSLILNWRSRGILQQTHFWKYKILSKEETQISTIFCIYVYKIIFLPFQRVRAISIGPT